MSYFNQEKWTFIVFITTLGLLVGALALRSLYDIPFRYLVMDPAAMTGINPLAGILSNLGVALWTASATICLFCAKLVKHRVQRDFLIWSGTFSLLMMCDDLLMLHERILPDYFNFPEVLVLAIYLMLGLLYVAHCYKTILATRCLFFGLAGLFLGASVLTDVIGGDYFGEYFIEEGSKLLGITCWCVYFIQANGDLLMGRLMQPAPLASTALFSKEPSLSSAI